MPSIIDEVKILVRAEVDKAISDLNKTEKQTDKTAEAMARLRDFMQGGVAAAKLAGSALAKLADIGANLYNEYASAELAGIKLNAAIDNSSKISYGASKRLSDYADELQNASIFEGDNTKAIIANLAAMGRSEDQITSLIDAASNLASATGQDLDSAVTQLNATLNGNAGILGRQNGAVRALTEEQLKNGDAVKLISEQYAGFNEKVGASASGSVKRLENSFGDLKETIGETIAISFQPMIDGINTAIRQTNEMLITQGIINKAKQNQTLTLEENRKLEAELVKNADLYNGSNSIGDQILLSKLGKIRDTIKAQEQSEYFSARITGNVKAEAAEREKLADAAIKAREKEKTKAEETEKARKKALEDSAIAAAELAKELNQVDLDTGTWLYLAEMQGEGAQAASDQNKANIDLLETLDEEKESVDALAMAIEKELSAAYVTMSEALGAALVTGEDGWKAFGKAGLGAVAAVIEALAQSWAVQGAAALIPGLTFNPAAAAGYFVASTAGYVAAGAIKSIPLAQGGIVNRPTYALLGENGPEKVTPLRGDNAIENTAPRITVIQNIAGSIRSERELEGIAMNGFATAMRGY